MSPKISWEKEIRCAHLVFYQSSWQRKWNRFAGIPSVMNFPLFTGYVTN